MNVGQIESLVDELVALDLNTTVDPSAVGYDARRTEMIDWAVRLLSTSVYLYGDVTLSIANNDREFNLDDTAKFGRAMLTIDRVRLGTTTWLRDATRRIGLFSVDQFNIAYPTHRTAAAGVPVAGCVAYNRLILDKPCNNTIATDDGFVIGRYVAALDTSDTNDVPTDLPVHLHECIAYLAAIKFTMPNADESDQWNRLKVYSQEASAMMIADFRRSYRMVHGSDPDKDRMRESCAIYRYNHEPRKEQQ